MYRWKSLSHVLVELIAFAAILPRAVLWSSDDHRPGLSLVLWLAYDLTRGQKGGREHSGKYRSEGHCGLLRR